MAQKLYRNNAYELISKWKKLRRYEIENAWKKKKKLS